MPPKILMIVFASYRIITILSSLLPKISTLCDPYREFSDFSSNFWFISGYPESSVSREGPTFAPIKHEMCMCNIL